MVLPEPLGPTMARPLRPWRPDMGGDLKAELGIAEAQAVDGDHVSSGFSGLGLLAARPGAVDAGGSVSVAGAGAGSTSVERRTR